MSTSLKNISVRNPKVWVNLNVAANIAVGTAVIIQNIGKGNIRVTESSDNPPLITAGYNILEENKFISMGVGSDILWAKGLHAESLVHMEVQ